MIGAFWICVFMVVVGIVLYLGELRWRRKKAEGRQESDMAADAGAPAVADGKQDDTAQKEEGSECCGLHLVCEKDSLSPMSGEVVYYDDEELDRFIGRDPHTYTDEEIEEFRDVLMTLRPEDVAGWARSVTQRRLELPPDVRDELLMLVNEQRGR